MGVIAVFLYSFESEMVTQVTWKDFFNLLILELPGRFLYLRARLFVEQAFSFKIQKNLSLIFL